LILKIALGILTSVGGFLEAGSLGTALEAGAAFRYQLLWALGLGAICVAFLTEMSGRLAAVRKQTPVDAMRKRFGIRAQAWPLGAQLLVDLLVLASEVGGAAFALQLATGISMSLWALPVAAAIWMVLWKGTFGQIEHGMAILGLVTGAFAVAAFKLHPDWHAVKTGLVPHAPADRPGEYAYLAVGILGASISPYLITFYSSGAIEEEWKKKDLPINRVVAGLGMAFGSSIAAAAMIVAAIVLAPRGVALESFDQAADMLNGPFGRAGFWLFCAALFIGCVGAAFEVALDFAYTIAQTLGWNWGEEARPATEARFSLMFTGALVLAVIPALLSVNPLKFTMFSMGITVLALPLVIAPLLVIMNDERLLGDQTNGPIANAAVILIIGLSFVLALLAIPLQFMGS
jgi:Mn2+/Fe2+ NRAMP family transporter